ncbi:MAG: hypothetical protein QF356_04025 [Acidimicrobiales bacterium]|nr:hypothetical protein [Acidimicrobiales bacterium]
MGVAFGTAIMWGMVQMDDDTRQALLLFNRRAAAAEAVAETARRLKKAVAAKDEAADALKAAQDGGGGAEVVAEAEAIWRAAVETWQMTRDGREPEPETEAPAEEKPEAS